MSKDNSSILTCLIGLAGLLICPVLCTGQYAAAEIILDPATHSATVKGKVSKGRGMRNLSFLRSAIGFSDLGSRISSISLQREPGGMVPMRRFSSTEFVAEADFTDFSYDVDLKPGEDARSAAHTSWLSDENGLLLLDDLLPRTDRENAGQVIITLRLPEKWKVVTTETRKGLDTYSVEKVDRAVFVLGKALREAAGTPEVAISGAWHFTDVEASGMAAEIHLDYHRIFGGNAAARSLVVVFPFPQADLPKGKWEAETRGSTIILASTDTSFKSQSLQRLHEQLRHEIFHLWLPNGVDLTGRYDWFYEGFALYQSLKTAVFLNQIRFDDFLDTLSRAHNIDSSQTQRRSLIEASDERWSGAETQLYARGMVVAFLADLVLLEGSKGKNSVEGLLHRLFATHKFPSKPSDANEALLKILGENPQLVSLTDEFIRGNKPIGLAPYIDRAGIENQPGTSGTKLRVKERPSGRQKTLLDKLGYNNWRKLTRK